VRLIADGSVTERPLIVRMDPRVEIGAADHERQTELSMACYRAYLRAQQVREAIDEALARAGASVTAERREQWMALRGTGTPRDGDILYDSISETASERETVVGLQQKLLFMLNVLQSADARPTPQAAEAAETLVARVPILEARWQALSPTAPPK
jgi:hypothetical protein